MHHVSETLYGFEYNQKLLFTFLITKLFFFFFTKGLHVFEKTEFFQFLALIKKKTHQIKLENLQHIRAVIPPWVLC